MLLFTLTACSGMSAGEGTDDYESRSDSPDVDLYLPKSFAGQSESRSGYSSGYEISYEKLEPEPINAGYWNITLPAPISLHNRVGLVGATIKSDGQSITVPHGHSVHKFSAKRDEKTSLTGLCIANIDVAGLNDSATAKKLKSIHKGKAKGKDLFNCFMYKPGSEKYFQLVMINDYGVGKFTRGILTDGSKAFQVQDLKGLVDRRTDKYVKGYNLVGYQISEDKQILSALRILNSYKTWLRKNIDQDTRQALAATMSVLSKSYNSRYRGAVVSRNTVPEK